LCSAASLSLLSVGIVATAGPASATHVSCGQTILVSTVLDSNVGPCAGTGLRVRADNITLDLNGFTISGGSAGEGGIGIEIQSRTGVTVKNGTVTKFDFGITLFGGSGNTVTGMRVLDNRSSSGDLRDGILLFLSDSNRITNNQVHNNRGHGIGVLESAFNVVDGNQSTGNASSGIYLESVGLEANDNVVINNLVSNNGAFGIEVSGGAVRNQIKFNQVSANVRGGITVFAGAHDNVIEGNRVQGNGGTGILIKEDEGGLRPVPTGNQILRNVSFGNATFDLRDDQTGCRRNQWHGNQAATFAPPCTMSP
jgi:parallel beta-helix repeat protein